MATITIRNAEIPAALEGLQELAQLKVPVAGALRVRKVLRALSEHWNDALEVRNQLARECCLLDDKGEPVQETQPDGSVTSPWRDDAAREDFQQRWAELLAQEFTHSYGIEIAHLGEIEVTAATLLKLGDLLVEPEDASEDA